MDFRVKKLILEEGMKNIAETKGVKLEMNFDDYHKTIEVEFKILSDDGFSFDFVRHACSYGSLESANVDVFVIIEKTRREVYEKKHPTPVGIMMPPRHGKSMLLNEMLKSGGINPRYGYFSKSSNLPKIKNVIFNYPATIVFWADGDKTVVKCQNNDFFDAEKGLAMAIIKKMNGGKGNYCEIFKPWMEKFELFYNKVRNDEAWSYKKAPDILEGEVDGNMINIDITDMINGKTDPLAVKMEPKEEEYRKIPEELLNLNKLNPIPVEAVKRTDKKCTTCKHVKKGFDDKPCDECDFDYSGWEPAE